MVNLANNVIKDKLLGETHHRVKFFSFSPVVRHKEDSIIVAITMES